MTVLIAAHFDSAQCTIIHWNSYKARYAILERRNDNQRSGQKYAFLVLNKKASTQNMPRLLKYGVPTGIRTPVLTVKGWCPRPLDDGDRTFSKTSDDLAINLTSVSLKRCDSSAISLCYAIVNFQKLFMRLLTNLKIVNTGNSSQIYAIFYNVEPKKYLKNHVIRQDTIRHRCYALPICPNPCMVRSLMRLKWGLKFKEPFFEAILKKPQITRVRSMRQEKSH